MVDGRGCRVDSAAEPGVTTATVVAMPAPAINLRRESLAVDFFCMPASSAIRRNSPT
jgi:hypothetical protein